MGSRGWKVPSAPPWVVVTPVVSLSVGFRGCVAHAWFRPCSGVHSQVFGRQPLSANVSKSHGLRSERGAQVPLGRGRCGPGLPGLSSGSTAPANGEIPLPELSSCALEMCFCDQMQYLAIPHVL